MVERTLRRKPTTDILTEVIDMAKLSTAGFNTNTLEQFAKTGKPSYDARRERENSSPPTQVSKMIIRRSVEAPVVRTLPPIIPTTVAIGSPAYFISIDLANRLNEGADRLTNWVRESETPINRARRA